MQSPRFQDLTQFKVPQGMRGRSAACVQAWWIVQGSLFRWSPQFLYGWRRFLLRMFGAKIGTGVLIRPSAKITYPWKLTVGDHSWIGDDAILYSWAKIEIGPHSVVSQKSYLCTGYHDHNNLSFDILAAPITIGRECWVAADVFVGPGISIGNGAVVGARSTVLHDLPPGTICLGNPAKPVRKRRALRKMNINRGINR
jgi:putative colanic acid biosynthesis acetyltransferase WcaF